MSVSKSLIGPPSRGKSGGHVGIQAGLRNAAAISPAGKFR
jgi:hypothetical protein